jgi:hypothetical protein
MRTILMTAALMATAACGEPEDDRPITAEYITAAITRPSCGTAACHSSATAREGYVFDTVEGVCNAVPFAAYAAGVDIDGAAVTPRMPLDSPLPDADIALLLAFEDPFFTGGTPAGCP